MGLEGRVETSISNTLRSMRSLNCVRFQSCLLTPVMLSSIEQLPNLETVGLIEYGDFSQGTDLSGLLPQSVGPNPFPKLTKLALQCTLAELRRYLSLLSDTP